MRQTYLLIILILPAVAILNSWFFGSELQRFTRAVRTISSTAEIEQFKAVVARQMYGALVQIVLLAVPPIVFFVGIVRGVLGPGDLVFVIVPSLVVIAVAVVYKRVEKEAQSIPVADDELRRQRDMIIHTWLKKPLPDW